MNIPTWDKLLNAWRRQAGQAAVGFSGATAAIAPEARPRTAGMPRGHGVSRPTEAAAVATREHVRRARHQLVTAGEQLLLLADQYELTLPPPKLPPLASRPPTSRRSRRTRQPGPTETQLCAWTHDAAGNVHGHVVNLWVRRQIGDWEAGQAFEAYRLGLEHLNRAVLELRMWLPATHPPVVAVKLCACHAQGCPCKNCGHPQESRCMCKPQPCPDQLLVTDRDISDRCRQRINRQNANEGSAA